MLRRFFPITSLIKGCLSWILRAIFAALLELIFPVAVNRVIDDFAKRQLEVDLIRLSGSTRHLCCQFLLSLRCHLLGHKLGINIETDMRKNCLIGFRSNPSVLTTTRRDI